MLRLPGLLWSAAVAAVVVATPAAALAAPAPPVTAPAGGSSAVASTARVIVRVGPGFDGTAFAAAVRTGGGRTISVEKELGLVVVDLPGGAAGPAAAGVRAVPGVRGLSADRRLRPTSLGFGPSAQPGSMTNITRITGAQSLWKSGITGTGVDVALVDSGVAPVAALGDKAKVVVGPDLSFESQDTDLRHLDTFGHGTHMGSIIAGREIAKASGNSYAADGGDFLGMAPDSRLVSVKVADHDGAVDVSQVIAAIDWVVQNKNAGGLNIKVLNLSYGTRSPQSWQNDPLSWAAEMAWHLGIVVVAAGGNDGSNGGGLSNPAYNPWVIAVGATDTKGTDSRTDDSVASYSARQGGQWAGRGLDLVAPGDKIVAAGVPGSSIYEGHPSARVGNGFIRGSGTSQAAAVVSGAVALLLQQRPGLAPDQVKDVLVRGATDLPGEGRGSEGAGELDVAKAAFTQPGATAMQTIAWGNGSGSLDAARNGIYVSMDGVDLRGEQDIMSQPWNSVAMAGSERHGYTWSWDGVFNGAQWTGIGFATDVTSWAGKTWSGKTWSGKTWSGKTWSGKTWSGKTWSGALWTGQGWTAAAWPTATRDTNLSAKLWSSATWG
jgi:serine protease AprX